MTELDRLSEKLALQWTAGNSTFVIRKLVGMPSVAEACYCAASIALRIVDPLDFLAEFGALITPRAATVAARPTAARIDKPDRAFSLSDLPDALDDGAMPDPDDEWD